MGFRIASQYILSDPALVLNGANPTVALTLSSINIPIDNAAVALFCFMQCNGDPTMTLFNVEIFRGDSMGVDIGGTDTGAIIANAPVSLSCVLVDNPGKSAELAYTVVVTATAATTNASLYGSLFAMML